MTIYFDKKNENGELINIFLNEKENINNSKTTFAKKAIIDIKKDKKILILYDGQSINIKNGKISEFKFSKSDYNISKFSTNTTTTKKIQETSTKDLVKCLMIFHKPVNKANISKISLDRNCDLDNLENIHQELYIRLIKPLYLTFLISISLLFILKSKNDDSYVVSKFKIYFFAFIFIVFLESSTNLINVNLIQNLFFSILPLIFTLIIYFYFLMKFKVNRS